MKILQDYAEHILSYLTALMAIFLSLPLMKIGGVILLLARLIVDVPPAYQKLKGAIYDITKGNTSK